MTPHPQRAARGWRRRRVAPLVAALLPLLPLLATGALPASASPVAAPPPSVEAVEPDTRLPVVLSLGDLRPRAPRAGDDLQVVGTVTNTTDRVVRALELRVRLGDRLVSRSQLAQADEVTPAYGTARAVRALPDLAPGARAAVDVRLPVDDLQLRSDGVYPLLLELRSGDTRVGQLPTYLPWFSTAELDPLRLAWLWPVVDQPRISPQGVLLDDELATSFTPQGRLGRSLAAARSAETVGCAPAVRPAPRPAGGAPAPPPLPCLPVPVTYAVDPDLLLHAQTMAGGYQVLDGATTRAGSGAAAAATWLASLQAGTAAGDLLALPYADPDVVALTRGTAALTADVAAARTYGVTVARDVLRQPLLQQVSFPPPGPLSDTAFDAITDGFTSAVVLDDDAVSGPEDDERTTPGARVRLPGSSAVGAVTGLVVDRRLSELLAPTGTQDARVAEQRWLVETAMIAAELPSRGRTLLVSPPRRGELDPAVAGTALADTGRVPWMCPVPLADVAAARERCPGAAPPSYAPERSASLVQPSGQTGALDAELAEQVADVRAEAAQLTGAVVKGGTVEAQALRARLQRAWLRGESSAWRGDRRAGARLVALAAADVAEQRRKVQVLTGSITLTSNRGRVSVSVVNELDQPVTVAVRLSAPSDARLSRTQTDVLEVPPRYSQTVPLDAQTLTSGRFVVKAQLLDRNGAPFGEPAELLVRSTRYGTVALGVTGLGAGVLLVAAGVRLVRRARRRIAS